MKLTENVWKIHEILHVHKGRIVPRSIECKRRHSDCFVYVLTGQAQYIFDDRPCLAEAGNIIYLAHGSKYSIHVTDENYTFIYFDFLLDAGPVPLENEIYKVKSPVTLENDFERLHKLWTLGDYSDRLYCMSLVYRIYSEIARACLSQYVPKRRKLQMEDAAKYMEEHLADSSLRISSLAQRYQLSEVHFRRTFYLVYRATPAGFLISLRIKKAKELLISETCGIAQISEKCGFQNHYYFSKVFKAATAVTPSEYRKYYGKIL